MWLSRDEKIQNAITELANAPDRSFGILAATIVDSQLSLLVKKVLHRDDSSYSQKVRAQVFDPEMPLGSFGSKISVAYLLGLISEDTHLDLQNLKNIRNLFAHYSEYDSFEHQKIKAKCANFRLVDRLVEGAFSYAPGGDKSKSFPLSGFIVEPDGTLRMATSDKDKIQKQARGRFMGTAQLFCAAATMMVTPKQENDQSPQLRFPLL